MGRDLARDARRHGRDPVNQINMPDLVAAASRNATVAILYMPTLPPTLRDALVTYLRLAEMRKTLSWWQVPGWFLLFTPARSRAVECLFGYEPCRRYMVIKARVEGVKLRGASVVLSYAAETFGVLP